MKKCLMKRNIVRVLSLCFLLFVVQISLGASFVEIDGMVVIEVEHYDAMRADTASGQVWELRTDETPDAASNGEYMKAPKPNTNDTNYGNLSDAVAEAPRLDYVCQLEGGTYIVWVRGTNDGGGSDTCHFGINYNGNGAQSDGVNNSINGIDFDNDAFMWSKKTQNGSNVVTVATAGEYVINVYQRENGARVDKLIITTDLGYTPPEPFGPDETAVSASAHTPTPKNGSTILSNDVKAGVPDPNWLSPLQDADGNPITDSNIVSVDKYEVWWSVDEEPNFLTDTPYDNDTSQTYDLAAAGEAAIDYEHVYYWRVDTHVTWDSNEITGNFTDVIEGSVWSFTTEPSYTPLVIETYNNVITTVDIATIGASLSATITGNSEPIDTVSWTVLTDDVDFPAGSDAAVVNTTTDNQNPTAQLTTTMAGIYKVKLTVTDAGELPNSPPTTVEAIAEVDVYADACEAQKDAPSGWSANYYDRDDDCDVDLVDLSVFAIDWLDSTAMDVQVEFDTLVGFVPADVYASRIEAEWAALSATTRPDWATDDDPNMYGDDPNSCSAWPMTDESGAPRLRDSSPATSFMRFSHGGVWADYEVDVQVANVPVDVYVGYATPNTGMLLRFSNAPATYPAETTYAGCVGDTVYGEIVVPDTGSYDVYYSHAGGTKIGEVTFTTTGIQRVRVAFTNPINLDWFNFDW